MVRSTVDSLMKDHTNERPPSFETTFFLLAIHIHVELMTKDSPLSDPFLLEFLGGQLLLDFNVWLNQSFPSCAFFF